jgi:osmotically-inducible protein OsmY
MRRRLFWPVLLLLPPLLGGCAAAVVGGAAASGALVAHDRRTSGIVLQDQQIELSAMQILRDNPDIKNRSDISITSYNLRVLLTGETESAEIARRFASQVAQLPHVSGVFNEVTEGARAGVWDETGDTYLTSKVKIALFDVEVEGFDPTAVKVVTARSTVYLMGLLSREEARQVVERVRRISGVEKVVEVFEYIDA